MNSRAAKQLCRWLPGLVLALLADESVAQRLGSGEPRWIEIYSMQGSLGIFAEGAAETSKSGGGDTLRYQRWFVGPSIGINSQGAFYHPNLAQWSLNGEFSPGWYEEKSNASGPQSKRSEFDWLNNFDARINLLSEKPYHSSVGVDQTHIFRNYDFFNTVTVDSLRYAGQTGYEEGPVPFNISAYHRTEKTTGLSTDSTLQDTGVLFDASNTRDHGETKLTGILTDYDRNDTSVSGNGSDATVALTDNETFGSRQQIHFSTALGFAHREFTGDPTDESGASANLTYEHTPALSSFYNANYLRSDSSPTLSDNYSVGLGLQHQLYESLNSTLSAQAFDSSSSGGGSSSDFSQYILTLSEIYTKKLGASTRLTVSGSSSVQANDQQNSGSANLVRNEKHTFPIISSAGPEQFSLNLPYVIQNTIVVRDTTGIVPPSGNYTVFENGALTYIERTIGSVRLLPGSTVFVDYDALPSASGSYQAYSQFGQIRLDFMDGRWGIFGRVASLENNAPPEIIAQEIWAWAVGSDYNWHWLRAGAEYELYDSNFSSYRTARLFQSLNFTLDDASSLTFDFTQAETRFIDAGRHEQYYAALQRYHRSLTRYFGMDFGVGGSWRVGKDVDATRYGVRPAIQFMKGKLTVRAGYDFEYSKFLQSEEHSSHMLFVRIMRIF